MNSSIILPEGIKVGHCSNSITGVTVVLSEGGSTAGVCVRGCAPGTRETDLLANEKIIEKINAVVLAGGSAYGLEACCGVMNYLRDKGCGHAMGSKVVPLVSGAVIYDLNDESGYNYPDFKMGEQAAKCAKNTDIEFGKVGVGTGATVGKIRGVEYSSEGGVGGWTVGSPELFVTAIVAVNAVGDVYNHNTNQIIAGARDNMGNFLDTKQCILSGNFKRLLYGTNTTIGCIITNANLTKLQANKLASIAHNGYAQSIKPVHTDHDGDTIFCISQGSAQADFTMLSVMAVEAVSLAITNAVSKK